MDLDPSDPNNPVNWNWNERNHPGKYIPVQLDGTLFPCYALGCIDWWYHRSQCCCCCHPLLRKLALGKGGTPGSFRYFDSLDPTVWKDYFAMPTKCPDSMKGVWWMCDNIAAETMLVFHDGRWSGNYNPAGTEGFGEVWKPLARAWPRPPTMFGFALAIFAAWKDADAASDDPAVISNAARGVLNFDAGKIKINDEWVFRINEDEWQKMSWDTKETPDDQPNYMYRWRRIIRADGTTTPHFEDYKARVTKPVPHRSCFEPWCWCWPMCACTGNKGCLQDMTYTSRTQMTIFPDPSKAKAQAPAPAQVAMPP